MAQRRWLRLLPALGSVLTLVGCSGTPFGDQLSRGFSTPDPATAPSGPTASQATPAAPAASKPAAPTTPAKPAPEPAAPQASRSAPAQPSQPAPYRVTIKLPAADPSAPAEVVTEALRAAGVAFEVETIERVPAGGEAGTAPVRTPAPPAR